MAVSGFSGAGKGTIMKKMLEKYPHYALSVSATTRQPREGEQEGVDYFYKSEEEFQRMIENEELLEYAGYVGHYYGTPRAYVEKMLKSGRNVLLEIEVQGALKVKEKNPDMLLAFVVAPSVEEIRNRLNGRGTESEQVIEERMAQIKREVQIIPKYDYLIVNEDVDRSVEILNNIVESERCKVEKNREFIEKLEKEINGGK